jgi:hypothetical protein
MAEQRDQVKADQQDAGDFESPDPIEQPDSPELEAANAKAEEGGAHPVADGTTFYTDVDQAAVGTATEEPRPVPPNGPPAQPEQQDDEEE